MTSFQKVCAAAVAAMLVAGFATGASAGDYKPSKPWFDYQQPSKPAGGGYGNGNGGYGKPDRPCGFVSCDNVKPYEPQKPSYDDKKVKDPYAKDPYAYRR